MTFRFPLAAVLRYRENLERNEELQLRTLQMELARVRRLIEQLTTEIAIAQQSRELALQKPIAVAHLQAMLSSVGAAIEQKKTLLNTLHALEQQHTEQLRSWQKARRGRQMLSEMQDHQRDAWEQKQLRMEQNFLDDLFAARRPRQ